MFLQFCPEINHLGCPCSCPNPGCLWCWTLPWTCPRWSWRSGNTLNQPSFSSQTAFANTTLPRNQSLGLSLLSSYFWLSLVLDLALDLTQMVLAVRKKLKSTHLNIPNNFCFNNFAQKAIPGVVLAHGLLLAVFGVWTSPRWSWPCRKS